MSRLLEFKTEWEVFQIHVLQGYEIRNSFITFQNKEVSLDTITSSFNDCVLVQFRLVDPFPVDHPGKLWVCTECGKANTQFGNFKSKHKSVHQRC